MKAACTIACLLALSGVSAALAAVNGRWVAKVENRKATQEIVFNLKADGDRLTGTVEMGRRGRAVEISEGKISGDEISFTTTNKGRNRKKEESKVLWKATISGNELKGTRQAEGARRGQPFTAVRQ